MERSRFWHPVGEDWAKLAEMCSDGFKCREFASVQLCSGGGNASPGAGSGGSAATVGTKEVELL